MFYIIIKLKRLVKSKMSPQGMSTKSFCVSYYRAIIAHEFASYYFEKKYDLVQRSIEIWHLLPLGGHLLNCTFSHMQKQLNYACPLQGLTKLLRQHRTVYSSHSPRWNMRDSRCWKLRDNSKSLKLRTVRGFKMLLALQWRMKTSQMHIYERTSHIKTALKYLKHSDTKTCTTTESQNYIYV